MEVVTIEMAREQARNEQKKYRHLLEKRKDKHLQILEASYSQLRRGRKLIDIYEVIKNAGLNTEGNPRLAIANLSLDTIFFNKVNERYAGAKGRGWYGSSRWNSLAVSLPDGTFPRWKVDSENQAGWNIIETKIKTKTPIVPAEFMPVGTLKPYYVLWDVEKWENVPRDPILLRRISRNIFAVLATWDLTPLEQAVIRGR